MAYTLEELQHHRRELLHRLDQIRAGYREGLNADFEEQAQELANADVQAELERITVEELAKIDAAIRRLEAAMGPNAG